MCLRIPISCLVSDSIYYFFLFMTSMITWPGVLMDVIFLHVGCGVGKRNFEIQVFPVFHDRSIGCQLYGLRVMKGVW